MGDTFGRPFKDANGLIGRPRSAPKAEMIVQVNPVAKSLEPIERSITFEYTSQNSLVIDLSRVFVDKIRIQRKDAIRLASWIFTTYSKKAKSNV